MYLTSLMYSTWCLVATKTTVCSWGFTTFLSRWSSSADLSSTRRWKNDSWEKTGDVKIFQARHALLTSICELGIHKWLLWIPRSLKKEPIKSRRQRGHSTFLMEGNGSFVSGETVCDDNWTQGITEQRWKKLYVEFFLLNRSKWSIPGFITHFERRGNPGMHYKTHCRGWFLWNEQF